MKHFFWLFFRKVVSSIQGFPGDDPSAVLFPNFDDIPEFADGTLCSPKNMIWSTYLASMLLVGLFHIKVDACGCTIILAACMDRVGSAKATHIHLHCLCGEGAWGNVLHFE